MKAILLILILIIPAAASSQHGTKKISFVGFTMGTRYQVIYFDEQERNFKESIDSLLKELNKSISNYDPSSEISQFNRHPSDRPFSLTPWLNEIVRKSKQVFDESRGAFDVTVLPLVNAWGFGAGKFLNPNRSQIDSILTFVGSDKLVLTNSSLSKSNPLVQVDLGGIGQGFGADVIADFLRSRNIVHFLVELGGEGVSSGKNLAEMRSWRIGILDPMSANEDQRFAFFVETQNTGFTTSSNYLNKRKINGKEIGHIIDPSTGYPVETDVLSATVFADDCTSADAWATAFIVMGSAKAIKYIETHSELDAILIYSSGNKKIETYISDRIKPFVIDNEQ